MINIILKRIIITAGIVAGFLTVFSLGLWIGSTKMYYHVEQPAGIDFSLFWDAYGKLEQKFINPEKIDNQKVVYGAIEGMTQSLGDPYTAFFAPSEAKKFQQDLSGSFSGIGVEIGYKKNLITVVAPLEATPGQRAGLKAGDFILKIDGKDATGMTTDEAVDLIRGPQGTNVTLNILRDSWTKAKDIVITRDTIKIPSMKWEMKGDTAYIHLYQFNENLSADFADAAEQIVAQKAKNIVLDLRDNPGGYLETSQEIAGWFLQQGQTVVSEKFGDGREPNIYKANGNRVFANTPVVVLINQGSASASEILAGALRDNRGIKLVGEKSFGKGSVQEVINLRGGSFLKITVAKWLTPKGTSISEVGLEPDVKVELTEKDTEQSKDPQLDKALEIVKSLPQGK